MPLHAKRPVALLTVRAEGQAAPSLDAAARQIGVAVADLDEGFGVVPIDPGQGLYAIRVWADRVPADPAAGGRYRGPFSDPGIAPLGPGKPAEPEEED